MKVTTRKAKPTGPVVRKPSAVVEEVKVEEMKIVAEPQIIANNNPPSLVEEVKPVAEVANNPIVINRKPPKPKPKYVKPITAADPPKVEEKKPEDTLEVTNSIKVADIRPAETTKEAVKETPIIPVSKPAPKKVQPKTTPVRTEKQSVAVDNTKVEKSFVKPEPPKNNGVTFKPIFRDEPNPNTEPQKSSEELGALSGLADVLSTLFVTKSELPSLVEKIINDLLIKNNK